MLADFVQTGVAAWWAPALAFLAGLVSFASPCVLPLVPGYLSFVSGVRAEDAIAGRHTGAGFRDKLLVPALLFVGGFTIVFVSLGVFSSALAPIVKSPVGMRVAGGVVVAFGALLILYALRRGGPAVYAERRPFLDRVKPGKAGALPLGMAFAAGWTPCIGPVLGAILGIASAQGGAARGGFLLLMYSLGLAVPFLLLSVGVDWLLRRLRWVQRHYRAIAGVSGAIMVAIGVLLMTGAWTRILAPLARLLPPI